MSVRHPSTRRPRPIAAAMAVLATLSVAACGGGSTDTGRADVVVATVAAAGDSPGTSSTSGTGGADTDRTAGRPDTGEAQTGSEPETPAAVVGQMCDDAGEGVTVELDAGQAVCTRMQGDGKLIWAWPDGTLGDAPGGPVGDASSLAGILAAGECDESSTIDRYSAPIVDPALLSHVYPLGGMLGNHITPVDHIYLYFPETSEEPADRPYPITSPADGRVVAIEDFRVGNGYPYPDHRIVIEHSCSLYSVFIHVGELRGPLVGALDSGALRAPIPVRAGEEIADDSLNPGFDFSTFDQEVQLDLANPASYLQAEQWKPYTADPLEYFPSDLRSAYESLSLRVADPIGGRIDWDLPGTARGNWFVEGTNGYRGVGDQAASYGNHGKVARGYWDTHLAAAPDAVDASAFVWSVGDWEGCPCQFLAVGNPDPSTIVAGAAPVVLELVEFSYENADGSPFDPKRPGRGYRLVPSGPVVGLLAVQVHDDGTMTVEKLPGRTSAAEFTGFGPNARTYVR